MDPAKTLRWCAFSVAALVVFMGAALIFSMVMRLSQAPSPEVSVSSVPASTDTTPAQPASASPQPASESAPDLYQPAPQTHSTPQAASRMRAASVAPPQAAAAPQTSPVLPSPGAPRPFTPDAPISSSGVVAAAAPETGQIATPAVTPTVSSPAPSNSERHTVILYAGTPINVSLWETLSTDQAKKGSYFRAILASSIIRDGFIIAQAGSAVTGQVIASKGPGMFGRSPELRLTLRDIRTTDNQVVRIQTYQWDEKGRSHNAVTGPFRSAFDVVAVRKPGTLILLPNTPLQFRLATPVSITERPH